MRTIYELDSNGIATGQSREIGPKDGRKPNWVVADVAPPQPYGRWLGGAWEQLDEYPTPPPPPEPEPVPNPLGFRMALITDPDLLPVYTAVNAAAMTSLAVSHAFLLFNESLWNEPWLEQASQASLGLLASVYAFTADDKTKLETAFTTYQLPLTFPAE